MPRAACGWRCTAGARGAATPRTAGGAAGGGAPRRYTADGRLDAVVELPTPQVTACTFGGPELDQLFITTSAENREGDPVAGSLFRADVGVPGLPVRKFAG